MCTGTSVLYKIPRILVGENITYRSPGEKWLNEHKIEFHVAQDQQCVQLMEAFIRDRPDLWNEDIHVVETGKE